MGTMKYDAEDVVRELVEESRLLWMPVRVPEFHSSGNTVSFLREHVCQSVPCVWRGAAGSWPSVLLWSSDGFGYLRSRVGDRKVGVAWTPDGRADAVVAVSNYDSDVNSESKVFAMPSHQVQSVSSLLDNMQGSITHSNDENINDGIGIPYYSAQDSNLTNDLPELLDDIDDETIRFATAAFEGSATAVNVWIGDERSVTATHADPFENIYAVIAGSKQFTLRPPCDAAVLPKPKLRRARWTRSESVPVDSETIQPVKSYSRWDLVVEQGMTAWIDEDSVTNSMGDELCVELRAGDVLYLPPLWCKSESLKEKKPIGIVLRVVT